MKECREIVKDTYGYTHFEIIRNDTGIVVFDFVTGVVYRREKAEEMLKQRGIEIISNKTGFNISLICQESAQFV